MTLVFGRLFKDLDGLNSCYQSTLMVGYGYPRCFPIVLPISQDPGFPNANSAIISSVLPPWGSMFIGLSPRPSIWITTAMATTYACVKSHLSPEHSAMLIHFISVVRGSMPNVLQTPETEGDVVRRLVRQ